MPLQQWKEIQSGAALHRLEGIAKGSPKGKKDAILDSALNRLATMAQPASSFGVRARYEYWDSFMNQKGEE